MFSSEYFYSISLYNTYGKSNKSGIIKLIVNKTLRMNFIYIMNITEKEETELSEKRRILFFCLQTSDLETNTH